MWRNWVRQDAGTLQEFIVPALGFDFVAEGVVAAGLVMDLFEDIVLTVSLSQPGVAAFALAQQFEQDIHGAVYSAGVHKAPPWVSLPGV